MILVVGGTGFVGTKVVHALRAAELPVRVLARRPEKQDQLRSWGCEVVQGDMTDAESLKRAVEGCTTVVHLVALPPFADAEAIERVMVQGTRDLVEASKQAGVTRLVLQSALGTEEGRGVAPYYDAKWEEEQAVKYSGIEHVIFRPSFIFGRDGGLLAPADQGRPLLARSSQSLAATACSRSGSTTSPRSSPPRCPPRRRTGRSTSAARTV